MSRVGVKSRRRREAGRLLLSLAQRGPRKPLTMQESLVIDLIFDYMGEPRHNRTFEQYETIAAKLPSIKVVHGIVNERLRELAQNPPRQFCYFKPGDRRAWYRDFPRWLSIEVVRRALVNFGLRRAQIRRPRKR
jgi:hypothetical protein